MQNAGSWAGWCQLLNSSILLFQMVIVKGGPRWQSILPKVMTACLPLLLFTLMSQSGRTCSHTHTHSDWPGLAGDGAVLPRPCAAGL